MQKITLYLMFFQLLCGNLHAQFVETILAHSTIVDGLFCGPDGNIYTTSGGLTGGNTIGQYNPTTNQYTAGFASGFSGPINIATFNDSTWLITNYDDNSLKSYHTYTGQVQTVATNLDGTAGIAIAPNGDAYITGWGGAPAYAGSRVFKYSATGQTSVFIDSTVIFRPQGICFDHEGNLYVASSTNVNNFGKIYKVPAGDSVLQLFATIGYGIGNMAFRQKDSCIYFPSNHRIIKLDMQGNSSIYSGFFQPGYADGTLSNARYEHPLGICFSPSEDSMYIAEAGNIRRLRRIVMTPTLNTKTVAPLTFEIFPNPSTTGRIHLNFSQTVDVTTVKVRVFDSLGQTITVPIELQKTGIQISSLAQGIYFVEFFYRQQSYIRKVVVNSTK